MVCLRQVGTVWEATVTHDGRAPLLIYGTLEFVQQEAARRDASPETLPPPSASSGLWPIRSIGLRQEPALTR